MNFHEAQIPAILDGSKTLTSRLMRPQPVLDGGVWRWSPKQGIDLNINHAVPFCPKAKIGDQFQVKGVTFEVTDIKPRRLWETTTTQCWKEGIIAEGECLYYMQDLMDKFQDLIESIYPGSWDCNEWVWGIYFKRVT